MLWGSSGLPLTASGSLHDGALPSSPQGVTWAGVRGWGQRHRYGARLELPRALAGACVVPRGGSRAQGPCRGQGTARGCLSTTLLQGGRDCSRARAAMLGLSRVPLLHQARPNIL